MRVRTRTSIGGVGAMREAVILIGYTAVFFGGLPTFLWLLGGRLDVLLGLPPIREDVPRIVGAALLLGGTVWFGWAMREFRVVGRGWPISHLPPTRLVTSGPYRVMRHPNYVGYTAGFVGAALLSGSLGRAVGAGALLTVGWLIYALRFEEPRLARRVGGQAFARYRSSTPLMPLPPCRTPGRALLRVRTAGSAPGEGRHAPPHPDAGPAGRRLGRW